MLAPSRGLDRLRISRVPAHSALPKKVMRRLSLNPKELVGYVGLDQHKHSQSSERSSLLFAVLAVEDSQAFCTDLLSQARNLIRDDNVLIYLSSSEECTGKCWLAQSAKCGFSSGSSFCLMDGSGILHMASKRACNLDQVLRQRRVSTSNLNRCRDMHATAPIQ